MLILVGAAKSGKSTLAGEIAYNGAALNGLVVYISPEMASMEIRSRWYAAAAFRRAPEDGSVWISYSSILRGIAWRGECGETERALLENAMNDMKPVLSRCYPERVAPGSTVEDVCRIVDAARRQHPDALPLVVIDPLQRLFAAPMGAAQGRVLEGINADEISRVGMVAQQVRDVADCEGWAVMATSDTTKAGAAGASSSSSLRGSYMLNHAATTILGLHVAPSVEMLVQRLMDGTIGEQADRAGIIAQLKGAIPHEWGSRKDLQPEALGMRYAYLDCSGNRNGPQNDLALAYVPGAMLFTERTSPKEPATPLRASTSATRHAQRRRKRA
jgi:hypothetical protein